jgi:hypothetical protein
VPYPPKPWVLERACEFNPSGPLAS